MCSWYCLVYFRMFWPLIPVLCASCQVVSADWEPEFAAQLAEARAMGFVATLHQNDEDTGADASLLDYFVARAVASRRA